MFIVCLLKKHELNFNASCLTLQKSLFLLIAIRNNFYSKKFSVNSIRAVIIEPLRSLTDLEIRQGNIL